jgi:hypothetical protein
VSTEIGYILSGRGDKDIGIVPGALGEGSS